MITNDYTNEQYHALPSISKSGLDLIAKSPAHFLAGFQGIGAKTARIGTATHSQILEGASGMIVAPDIPYRSAANKDDWDDWFAENGATSPIAKAGFKSDDKFPEFERQTGLTVVTESEFNNIKQMHESAMHKADHLLLNGLAEQSILFNYRDVDCRCRPDFMNTEHHYIVDVKSTKDASERGFRRSVAQYRYHVQQAFYCTGYQVETGHWPEFYFLAIDKSAPFLSAIYKLDSEALEHGLMLMERDIGTYIDCMETGRWPGYEDNHELSIPIWDAPEVVEGYDELVA